MTVWKAARLVVIAIGATVLSQQWTGGSVIRANAGPCYCASYPVLFDYSNNVITDGGEQDYQGFRSSNVDCAANFCQGNVTNEGAALCDAQGWGTGDGYVKVGSGWTGTGFQGGWGWTFYNNYPSMYPFQDGFVGPQQTDCGDF